MAVWVGTGNALESVVGKTIDNLGEQAIVAGTHSVVGGALSIAQGGSFLEGFASAGLGSVGGFAGEGLGGSGADGFYIRTAMAATAGGIAAEITGGKFSNGTITAAFAHMYNDESHFFEAASAGLTVAGMAGVPLAGEILDAAVIVDPSSAWWEKGLSAVSLAANIFTAGLLPNAGPYLRAVGHLCSFEGSTEVETPYGRLAIKDLTPGEKVLARDEETGEMAFKAVMAKFLHPDPDRTLLTVRDRATGAVQTLTTTPNHPFYVAEAAIPELRLVANGGVARTGTNATGRWVDAGALKPKRSTADLGWRLCRRRLRHA